MGQDYETSQALLLPRRPSKSMSGYHVVRDPLSDCEEDEFICNFYRARVAAEGNVKRMWYVASIYARPRGFKQMFSKNKPMIGQEIRPLTLEKSEEFLEDPNKTEFFVTVEEYSDPLEKFTWWSK